MRRLVGFSVRDTPSTCENASAVEGGASATATAIWSKGVRRCG
jgi:hypothetical protein